MTDSKLFLEAIALKRCMGATYNRMRMLLAPHILYTKHGDLFLDAVVISRDGKEPSEVKLGVFKLAGLQDVEVIARSFHPLPGFNAGDEKYLETTPFAVG